MRQTGVKFLTFTKWWHKLWVRCQLCFVCVYQSAHPSGAQRPVAWMDGVYRSCHMGSLITALRLLLCAIKRADKLHLGRGYHGDFHSAFWQWAVCDVSPYHLSSLNYTQQTLKSILMRGLLARTQLSLKLALPPPAHFLQVMLHININDFRHTDKSDMYGVE